MPPPPDSLLTQSSCEALRERLADAYTVDEIASVLGIQGEAAMSRSDVDSAERLSRGGTATESFFRLFRLGLDVSEEEATECFGRPLLLDLVGAGVLRQSDHGIRARLAVQAIAIGGATRWVFCDFGPDVRPGVVEVEHVLGPGHAATTLAQATIRRPVRRALDVGTGCGVQALYLSEHAAEVTATDLSSRAVALATATADLNGLPWRVLEGSLLDPVAHERFDLVVCNPPFVVGPGFTVGSDGFRYRDSGLVGDEVCRRLVSGLPSVLNDGGIAQLLANWAITADESWQERLASWLPSGLVDAWIWQREVAEPSEYVALWLRDGGLVPGTDEWRRRHREWMDWFVEDGVLAVGMGLISLVRRDGGTAVFDEVPQAVDAPIGAHIWAWFDRHAWLRDEAHTWLSEHFRTAPDLVLDAASTLVPGQGWQVALTTLRQSHGLRWEVETDEVIAGLVAACDGTVAMSAILDLVAGSLDVDAESVTAAVRPVVFDLVRRGFLIPSAVRS